MLSRRHLRVKAMQALFAYQRSVDAPLSVGEKLLKQSLDRIEDLYIHQLAYLIEIRSLALRRIEDNKQKLMPTEEDLNPNLRFVENPVLEQLCENHEVQEKIGKRKVSWDEHVELTRRIYTHFQESEAYHTYMSAQEVTRKDHRKILHALIDEHISSNDHLRSIFEEKSIFWVNDFEQVTEMVKRTIASFKQADGPEKTLPPIYKDEEEDRKFVIDLFRKTVSHTSEFDKMINEKLENWDLDRIASTDILLMKMALCEFLYINSVPTKVTMNEYIEISKEYSTPKSKVFINGILDKLLIELKNEGQIKKVGKGLIGS